MSKNFLLAFKKALSRTEDVAHVLFNGCDDLFRSPSQAVLDQRLQNAVLGKLELLASVALKQGANPNARFALPQDRVSAMNYFNEFSRRKLDDNPSLLEVAAESGAKRIVQKMLSAGADPSL